MRKSKLAMILSWTLVMVLCLTACGKGSGSKEESPAVGTWIGQYGKFVGDSDEWRNYEEEFSLELKANGTGVHHRDELDIDVTWELNGEDITMTEKFMGMTTEYTGTLVGDDLHLFNGDPDNDFTYEYVYLREGGTSSETGSFSADSSKEEESSSRTEGETSGESTVAVSGGEAGKYLIYEYEAGGMVIGQDTLAQSGMDSTYVDFKEDGTGEINLMGSSMEITWKDGDISLYGVKSYTYTIDGNIMTLDMQGVIYRLYKEGTTAPVSQETVEEESASASESSQTESASSSTSSDAPTGSGLVSQDRVMKGYVWLHDVASAPFKTTYEQLRDFMGTDGELDQDWFDDHMQMNMRTYKWTSNEDSYIYLYVNFQEKDAENNPGVYSVSGYNSNGFTGSQASELYLEELKEEIRQQEIAMAASMPMKEFSVDIAMWGDSSDFITFTMQIPETGWSWHERKAKLVDNDDPEAWDAGFIQFEIDDSIEDFDYYKDSFEDYQEQEDRVIGGITFKARTYKNIGYNYLEYIAQYDATHAISIKIVKLDVTEGTIAGRILSSLTFK